PGYEVACMTAGKVLQLSPGMSGWDIYELASTGIYPSLMGEQPTIEIGNVYSGNSGNEIVLQGGSINHYGLIQMIHNDPISGWNAATVRDFDGFIGGTWCARVGDFDSRYAGDEIFYIYEGVYDFSVGYSLRPVFTGNPLWWTYQEELIYDAEVGMDAGIGDFDPSHPGNEIVVVTEMGPAYEVSGMQVGKIWSWTQTEIFNMTIVDAGWTVEVADVNNADGIEEIVFGTRYNNKIVLSEYDPVTGLHNPQVLFIGNATSNPKNMWDVAVGNVIGSNNKLEIVGVDDTGSVYLVDYNGVSWQGRTIWQDTDGLYAVVVGDFVPGWGSDEILVAGESGKITMLSIAFDGDLTGEGDVNYDDLDEFAQAWLTDDSSADFMPQPYGDGIVNFLELAVLADNWLE
ncbi:MAG: hypothetical protein WC962_07420, partial [Phycisphaerae bacterium]